MHVSCLDGSPLDCSPPQQQARAAAPEATATRSSQPAKPFGAESGRRSVASLMPWQEGGDDGWQGYNLAESSSLFSMLL